MNLQKKLSDNLTLHYVEGNNFDNNDNGDEVVTMYELSFTFYEKHYMVYLSRENINKDFCSYSSVEGDGELFDSLTSLIEDDFWTEIVSQCNAFDKWCKELEV